MFVKDRAEVVGCNNGKYSQFDYPSHQAMVDAEVEIMISARELYPYVPRIFEYDRKTQQITMEKVEGEGLGEYIERTGHSLILNKLREAVKQLRSKEVTLIHQGPDRHSRGYLCYYDYDESNFMVDAEENLWFIDWDISGVQPKEYLIHDDRAINDFIKDLLSGFETDL